VFFGCLFFFRYEPLTGDDDPADDSAHAAPPESFPGECRTALANLIPHAEFSGQNRGLLVIFGCFGVCFWAWDGFLSRKSGDFDGF
jgi:hypothetical protein